MRHLAVWICTTFGFLPALAQPPRPTMVVIAPHPDDAEASCGGLIANAAASDQEVVILSMTAGEIGVPGASWHDARAVRSAEARKAAAILGARVEFFGAIDGSLTADSAIAEKLEQTLLRLRPTTVIAPWPLDVHPDHQVTGLLAWRVFLDRRSTFELYFYETTNSPHTTSFRFVPTDYVDISESAGKKRDATYQHASQNPAEWFDLYLTLARVRGYESDVDFAEGYIKARSASGLGGRPARTVRTLGGTTQNRPATDTADARKVDATPPDWAGLGRYLPENSRVGLPKPAEMRVVFFGDSITERWPATVPAFFDGRPYLGRGISGQTTAQMLVRFHQDVVALEPHAVVILAGTNDIAGNTGPYRQEDTFNHLTSMVELARARRIRVVLASILPARDYGWSPGLTPAPKILALNARLREYARQNGVVYLDYHSAMADDEGGLKASLGDDGVHPNRAGYAVMGPLAEDALRQALASD